MDRNENDDSPVVLRQRTIGEQQRSEKLQSVKSRDLMSFILRNNEEHYFIEKQYR